MAKTNNKVNQGHRSTGHRSTGNYSTGNFSTGDYSTGDYSTGDYSTGDYSTGYCSTGDYSTGDYSTGNYSTGNFSTGDYSTGNFCTETSRPMFFDQPWDGTWEEAAELIPGIHLPIGTKWTEAKDMTDEQKANFPNYGTIDGCLEPFNRTVQEAFPLAWANMNVDTRQRFLDLPNFDAEKFLACTGVDVRKSSPKDEIVIDGVKYRRVEKHNG